MLLQNSVKAKHRPARKPGSSSPSPLRVDDPVVPPLPGSTGNGFVSGALSRYVAPLCAAMRRFGVTRRTGARWHGMTRRECAASRHLLRSVE